MTIGFSNQAIGFKKSKQVKTYTFSKQEFDPAKVPPYAYNLTTTDDTVSFQCAFDSMGDPIMKKSES